MARAGIRAAAISEVDYTLQRRALVRDVRLGRVRREDVCDAHPELRRAASHVGDRIGRRCPICRAVELVVVRYVFGPRLPAHGRCVASMGEFDRIRRRRGSFDCYEVEVCTACWWNHLVRMFRFRGGHAG